LWSRRALRGEIRYEISRSHPLVERLQRGPPEEGGPINLEPLLLAIEASLPLDSLFSDIGAAPQSMKQGEMSGTSLEQLMAAFVEAIAPNSDSISAKDAQNLLETTFFADRPDAAEILHALRRVEPDL
jgi:hypothetical protein